MTVAPSSHGTKSNSPKRGRTGGPAHARARLGAPEVIDATRRGDPSACGREAVHHQWTLMCLELWARTFVDRPRAELGAPLPALEWSGVRVS